MLCILNNNIDPYFNLASEEYLFEQVKDDIFMLWRNEPSIIVGKFQNTNAEINQEYVSRNNIKVVRRLSGGGAVFHDLGNLNFTFIEHNSQGNFRSFTKPILDVLKQLSVNAQFEGRNDLTINGLKFSGNAEYIHQKTILHHGTLLFASQMSDMSAALNVNPLKFQDKAVKSVRKRVTNISEHLLSPLDVSEFAELVMQHVMECNPNAKPHSFSHEDIQQIEQIKRRKYETWDWNFGKSPQYTFRKMMRTIGGNIEVCFNVKQGRIYDFHLYGDFFSLKEISNLEQLFNNQLHKEEVVASILVNNPVEHYIRNITNAEFLPLFF